MRNQIAMPVIAQAKESRLSAWLNQENRIMTLFNEGQAVTNRDMLHALHVCTSFSVMALLANLSTIAMTFGLLWFIGSIILAKKGGKQ